VLSPGHYRGMHGYDAALPEMRSTFLIEGKGVPTARDIGSIDMRDIAPTLAALLGVQLPQAQGKALLEVDTAVASNAQSRSQPAHSRMEVDTK
jgi:predicted AlkP superfamily pyrophosphatase or phosphodiesterase